ncbi:alpha/beta-hydrolase [Aspergillus affinis]|uniref:alpha/beta-hydrolase n=1 Tax=Aspergillus affinis TaxID=1070780 RepID=UPI0022FED61E|nr:alpha/beta-hydrolase [Aspergillus affinis]KAI9035913.1 alpha/beta-hydrolase [Aspergillus affinis]
MLSPPPPHPLTPGPHTFLSASKNLTFEYIIHSNTPEHPSHVNHNLIIIHPPAWGLGSSYLQHGLRPLLTRCPSSSPSSSSPKPKPYILLMHHPRGTGASTRPLSQTAMSSFELASDLEDLRIHLNLEKIPTLLGHSNGGAIALSYAEMYPDRVEKLVLVGGQLVGFKNITLAEEEERSVEDQRRGSQDEDEGVVNDGNDRGSGSVNRPGKENDNENRNEERHEDGDKQQHSKKDINTNVLENPRHDPRYSSTSTLKLNRSSDETFTASVNAIWPLYFSNPTQHLHSLLSAIGDHVMPVWCYEWVYGSDQVYEESGEMVSRLGDVKAQTLIISGAEDLACRVESAEKMRDGIAGSRLVVCEECGHFPWIEAREKTLHEIRRFVEKT